MKAKTITFRRRTKVTLDWNCGARARGWGIVQLCDSGLRKLLCLPKDATRFLVEFTEKKPTEHNHWLHITRTSFGSASWSGVNYYECGIAGNRDGMYTGASLYLRDQYEKGYRYVSVFIEE